MKTHFTVTIPLNSLEVIRLKVHCARRGLRLGSFVRSAILDALGKPETSELYYNPVTDVMTEE